MTVFRASALIAVGLPLAALGSVALTAPAQAQVADDIVLNIMRQCAQIDDATARLACYDNNIRSSGSSSSRTSVPGQMSAPQSSARAPLQTTGTQGFGREDIRTPERFENAPGELDELTATVTAVTQRERGVYVITLEDGARWAFAESVDFSYRPPRVGSEVVIDRASLGSFLMRYNNQKSIRVRRER